MRKTNNPGAGPLSGVPLLDKFRQILHGPSRMNDPCRGTSLAERMGTSEFNVGSHYATTVIRRVDDSDEQNHGKSRFTGMNLLLKAVLNSSDSGQYIRQGASERTR